MLCDELQTYIATTLAEERTPERMAAAAEHVRECPRCSAFLSETLNIEKQLSMLPPIPAGAAVKQAVMARIQSAKRAPAEVAEESHGELVFSVLLVLGLLFTGLSYCVLARNGQWLGHSWTLRLHLAEHFGYNAFSQPWPVVVFCALAASLIAAAILWHDLRTSEIEDN